MIYSLPFLVVSYRTTAPVWSSRIPRAPTHAEWREDLKRSQTCPSREGHDRLIQSATRAASNEKRLRIRDGRVEVVYRQNKVIGEAHAQTE